MELTRVREIDGTTAQVRLGDVRTAFSAQCHTPDRRRALVPLAVDLILYGTSMAAVVVLDAPLARLAAGVVAGAAVACMFVWAHDAAHGTLFRSRRAAELAGSLMMLPSLQMYRLWIYGHNRVHHGFTNLVSIDWIWRPWTLEEYRAAPRAERLGYRVERSLLGCGWHYLRRVWWDGMVRFKASPTHRGDARLGKALVAGWLVGAGGLLGWAAGPWAAVCGVVVPWLVFTSLIALFTFLHHTHPTLSRVLERAAWNPVAGQLQGSTVIRCSRPVEALTHGILIHAPHHLDVRIPFYRLERAWDDLAASAWGDEVLTYRFRWSTVREIFRACKLYDYDAQAWSGFPRSHR